MSGPINHAAAQNKGDQRWIPVMVCIGIVILLLLAANVQLWRVADRTGDQNTESAQVPPLPAAKSGNRGLLRELDQSQRRLDRSLAGLRQDVSQAAAEVQPPPDLSAQLGELTEQSRALPSSTRALNGLRGDIQPLSGVAPSVGVLPSRLSGLSDRLEQTQRLSRKVDTLNTRLRESKSLPKDLAKLNSSTSTLAGKADSLGERADSTGTRIDNLNARVDGLSRDMQALDSRLTEMNTTLGNVNTTIGSLATLTTQTNQLLRTIVDLICQGNTSPACSPDSGTPTTP